MVNSKGLPLVDIATNLYIRGALAESKHVPLPEGLSTLRAKQRALKQCRVYLLPSGVISGTVRRRFLAELQIQGLCMRWRGLYRREPRHLTQLFSQKNAEVDNIATREMVTHQAGGAYKHTDLSSTSARAETSAMKNACKFVT